MSAARKLMEAITSMDVDTGPMRAVTIVLGVPLMVVFVSILGGFTDSVGWLRSAMLPCNAMLCMFAFVLWRRKRMGLR